MPQRQNNPEDAWRFIQKTPTCWWWIGGKDNNGYGRFSMRMKSLNAHRVVYAMFKGPIPAGLTIDHLCRNKGCVNPDHLEAVTNRENLLRGDTIVARYAKATHCKHGHEFTPKNTRRTPKRGRECLICRLESTRERRRRKKNEQNRS